jgi:hypothetical protein
VRAEFYRPGSSSREPVGRAEWTGDGIHLSPEDGAISDALRRIFRRTPIAVDDPALRSAGTSGPTILQPGTLLWFISAARARAEEEGFAVNLVPEGEGSMGWDPAAGYRSFVQSVERKERMGRPIRRSKPRSGEGWLVGERE